MKINPKTKLIEALAKKDSTIKVFEYTLSEFKKKDRDKIICDELNGFTLMDMVMFIVAVLNNDKDEIAFNFCNRILEGIESN